jgi:hypothetical protein
VIRSGRVVANGDHFPTVRRGIVLEGKGVPCVKFRILILNLEIPALMAMFALCWHFSLLVFRLFFGFQYFRQPKRSVPIPASQVQPQTVHEEIGEAPSPVADSKSIASPSNFGWLTFIAKPSLPFFEKRRKIVFITVGPDNFPDRHRQVHALPYPGNVESNRGRSRPFIELLHAIETNQNRNTGDSNESIQVTF